MAAVADRAVRGAGYSTIVVPTAGEALTALQQQKIDLLLLDLVLPDMDGRELCRRLRADVRFRALPIIMLTSLGTVRDRVAGLDLGADDYVPKPYADEELLARIRARLRGGAPAAAAEAPRRTLANPNAAVIETPSGEVVLAARVSPFAKFVDAMTFIRALEAHLSTNARAAKVEVQSLRSETLYLSIRYAGAMPLLERLLSVPNYGLSLVGSEPGLVTLECQASRRSSGGPQRR